MQLDRAAKSRGTGSPIADRIPNSTITPGISLRQMIVVSAGLVQSSLGYRTIIWLPGAF